MPISPPVFQSQLSQQVNANNFIALQSAQRTVSNSGASGSQSITFTNIPGTLRVTFQFTNTGTKGCYISGSNSVTGVTPAVASTSTPQPTSGTNAVSNCHYVAAGAILQLDFIQGTDTIAAICAGADTTTLEISIGQGQ